jgi:hypothetical protein
VRRVDMCCQMSVRAADAAVGSRRMAVARRAGAVGWKKYRLLSAFYLSPPGVRQLPPSRWIAPLRNASRSRRRCTGGEGYKIPQWRVQVGTNQGAHDHLVLRLMSAMHDPAFCCAIATAILPPRARLRARVELNLRHTACKCIDGCAQIECATSGHFAHRFGKNAGDACPTRFEILIYWQFKRPHTEQNRNI